MAAQISESADPFEAFRPAFEAIGGRIVGGYPFGEYDTLAAIQAPDDTAAAGVALAVVAAGAVRSASTTRHRIPAARVLSGARRLVGDPLRPISNREEIAGLDQFMRFKTLERTRLVAARLDIYRATGSLHGWDDELKSRTYRLTERGLFCSGGNSRFKIRSRHKLMITRRLSHHDWSARTRPIIPASLGHEVRLPY